MYFLLVIPNEIYSGRSKRDCVCGIGAALIATTIYQN